jgi:hypothetical protein
LHFAITFSNSDKDTKKKEDLNVIVETGLFVFASRSQLLIISVLISPHNQQQDEISGVIDRNNGHERARTGERSLRCTIKKLFSGRTGREAFTDK